MSTAVDGALDESSDLKQKVTEIENTVQRKVDQFGSQLQTTKDRVQEFNETAVHFIQERPVAAIGIALGAGYLLGKLASSRWLA